MYSQNQNYQNYQGQGLGPSQGPNQGRGNTQDMGIAQLLKSPQNLQLISGQVYAMAKQYYNIELDARFKNTLLSTVDTTLKQFGHKTVKITDQQHIENLNKIIIDDCMRYVQQYRNTMGSTASGTGNNANPFADLTDHRLDGDHLSKAVDDLAAARGYNFQHRDMNNNGPPRLDFAEPHQDRRLTSDELTRKLEVERGLFGTSQARPDGVQLHEMLGTSRPNDPYWAQQGMQGYQGSYQGGGGYQTPMNAQQWSPNNDGNYDNRDGADNRDYRGDDGRGPDGGDDGRGRDDRYDNRNHDYDNRSDRSESNDKYNDRDSDYDRDGRRRNDRNDRYDDRDSRDRERRGDRRNDDRNPVKDEYTRRLNNIRGRADNDRTQQGSSQNPRNSQNSQNYSSLDRNNNNNRRPNNNILPIDLPRGHSSLNNQDRFDRSDARGNRDQRDNRDSRDQRDNRDSRDQKDGRDGREGRDSRDQRDNRDNRENRDLRDSRGILDASLRTMTIPAKNTVGLCLDMKHSLESKTSDSTYVLRFNKIDNLRGIQLNSFICPNYKALETEPNLGLRIGNLPSRYGNLNLFSKMNLSNTVNTYNNYKPSEVEPLMFDRPLYDFNHLEFSIRNWDDQPIKLETIDVEQILKNSKNGTMKIVCREPHYLVLGDPVSFSLAITEILDNNKVSETANTSPVNKGIDTNVEKSVYAQRLEVLKICDDLTFITELPKRMDGDISITRIYPRITLNFTVF